MNFIPTTRANREDRRQAAIMKGAGTLLLTLILSGFSTPAVFATTWPSHGTAASVQSIHNNQAQNGDTITLPAGTFTWANGVTIRKGITLQGAAGATQINRAPGFRNALITITGLPTNLPVRVTGIRFNQPIGQDADRQAILINGPYGGTWGLTHVRFDHCYFYGGLRTILLRYRVNGVADHNTFHNCAYITQYFGDDDFAWNRVGTPVFGTSDSFFFEDNSIIADSAITYFDTLSDQNTGGRLVWRHNTFNTTTFTGVMGSLIGEHGNQLYWQGHDDWQRGGISCEFYNNTVRFGNAFRIIWFRGGRNVVANNTFVGNIGTGKIIAFDDEEGITGVIPPTRTVWPAEDQVNNNFYFNNTLNGSPLGPSRIGPWQTGTSTFVQVNRDYWLQPPSPSTVTNYPHPTSPSLPSYPLPYNPAVTAWTPYVYPHPLNTSLNRATLGNISTRGFVQTGDNVMVGGFIIQGTEPKTVIMRAIGPSLTPFGIPNALADPTLELHDGTGALIASNYNWQTTHIGGIITANQVSAIQNSGYAPSQASESAIIATLPPGNYTAIVSGVNNTTGVALVDVYDLQ